MSASGRDDRVVLACDAALNHVFGCGLTIAAISGRSDLNDEVTQRLGDASAELDMAVNALRQAAFTALVADHARQVAAPAPRAAVNGVPAPVMQVETAVNGARRRLCRLGDDAFAYALHGHDFYRFSDHELWAHETEGLLLSARSGIPFARRDGRVFYDLDTNAPLYCEDHHTAAPRTLRSSRPMSAFPEPVESSSFDVEA